MQLIEPMGGCQVVVADERVILFGQPPEVIKALARNAINRLDVLVLLDTRERSGVLLNNLEFPLYQFLFISNGLQEGRRLQLIGHQTLVSQTLEALRLTLLGPTREALVGWGTEPELREEWLNTREFFALKRPNGDIIDVADFFDIRYLGDGVVELGGGVAIEHTGTDRYQLVRDDQQLDVDVSGDVEVVPPYPINADQVPIQLVSFGIEVLGGASGFSLAEASTGMALCYHGNHILIDCIPFLDSHLAARGISKNQVRAIILTHLHDDHCNMFPLMLATRTVEVITTREIFEMAMTKLALALGWRKEVVAESFQLLEVTPGVPFQYYGMEIDAHVTVHSIPTIGVTVSTSHLGVRKRICVVGDNQSFDEIGEMRAKGMLRESTEQNLRRLYREKFDLLVADGGMGAIHGDPADALQSQAEQVVFVHVDRLPDEFTATFSLAGAGKRYTVVDGGSDLYTARALEFFMANFEEPVPSRWLSALLGDMRIVRFNRDDVILKQASSTRGLVFLVLTGQCDVIVHDGKRSTLVGTREAGDFIGEMAAVTGLETRNASVRASTPVTLCEFSEQTFLSFVNAQGLTSHLKSSWGLREQLAHVPALNQLSTSVIERICRIAESIAVPPGGTMEAAAGNWYLLVGGTAVDPSDLSTIDHAREGGTCPLGGPGWSKLHSPEGCQIVRVPVAVVHELLTRVPQFSYQLRKFRNAQRKGGTADWIDSGVR
jgi:CRP-like cAMP-binding protein